MGGRSAGMKQGSGSGVTGDHHTPDTQICRIAAHDVHPGPYKSPIENPGSKRYADPAAKTPHVAEPAAPYRSVRVISYR